MKDEIVYTHSDDPLQVDIEQYLNGLRPEGEQHKEKHGGKDVEREKALCKEVMLFCERIERKCYANRCPLRNTGCINHVSFTGFYKKMSPLKKQSIEAIIENEVRHYDEIMAEYNATKAKDKKQTPKSKVHCRRSIF